jgi:hypothetical protein
VQQNIRLDIVHQLLYILKGSPMSVGFRTARRWLIDALKSGLFDHEAREALAGKNYLAIHRVSVETVVMLLQRCSGAQYRESLHHADRSVTVHVFQPIDAERVRWYIKAYKVGTVIFISVHPSSY